jgi:hypothetical protein
MKKEQQYIKLGRETGIPQGNIAGMGNSRPIGDRAACSFDLHLRRSLGLALEWDGPDDHLVVDGGQGGADEGADPEDPLQRRNLEGFG